MLESFMLLGFLTSTQPTAALKGDRATEFRRKGRAGAIALTRHRVVGFTLALKGDRATEFRCKGRVGAIAPTPIAPQPHRFTLALKGDRATEFRRRGRFGAIALNSYHIGSKAFEV